MSIMTPLSAMPPVHEEHHQRAQEEDQEGENAQEMSCMFGQQKEGANRKKSEQDQGGLA
jgi:hypothetical protein